MNADQLRSIQTPLKQRYKDEPAAAVVTLKAEGRAAGLVCKVSTGEALAACAGVALRAVATSIGVDVRDTTVRAEGDLDFRGTMGVVKDVPVGFQDIRLHFDLDTDASEEQRTTLIRLTERCCVVSQTLRLAPAVSAI